MAIYLHIHDKLALVIRKFDVQLYKETISNLEISKILIPQEARVIESEALPINDEYKFSGKKIVLWKYQHDFFFLFSNENGLKIRFHPDIHLEYAYKNSSRQGFHLFYENVRVGLSRKIRLKFYNGSKVIYFITVESVSELMNLIFDIDNPSIHLILMKDWLVISEFSEHFYLKSESDLHLLRTLYLTNSPTAKIKLEEPNGTINFLFNTEKISLPLFKSNEVLMLFLRKNYSISTQYQFRPDIYDPLTYSQIMPNALVEVMRNEVVDNSERKKKCKCGGVITNSICSTLGCPF